MEQHIPFVGMGSLSSIVFIVGGLLMVIEALIRSRREMRPAWVTKRLFPALPFLCQVFASESHSKISPRKRC
jgi:hypothetical protein